MKTAMGDWRKKAHEMEVTAADGSAVHNGRAKRSKVGENARYGSENANVNGGLVASRGVVKDCEGALAALQRRDRDVEEEASRATEEWARAVAEQWARRNAEAEERARREAEVEVCQCMHEHAPGATMETALEIGDSDDEPVENAIEIGDSDDEAENAVGIRDGDDELKVLAILARPLLVKHQPPIDHTHMELIDGAHLTADDISGHQRNHKMLTLAHSPEAPEQPPMDEVPTDKGSSTSIDGEDLASSTKSMLKEVKSALKEFKKENKESKVKKPSARRAGKAVVLGKTVTPTKGDRGKDRNEDDEDGDDWKEHTFGSPRYKKPREVKFAQSDEDEPDYEVRVDSDREPSPEVEDPFAEIWKECAIMARQSKRSEEDDDDEEGQKRCEHTWEIRNDVGKACSLCGLIKEDIKDMFFKFNRPCYISKPWTRRVRVDTWEGDGDRMLEEEAKLVGMSPLLAHTSLDSAMHPHQQEGFKFLSRNLVEEDSGGCMLAFAPGTGKSFLMISFIHSFMLQVPNARPMIVAPKSMLRPWVQEFKKWQVEETTVLNLYEAGDDAAKVEMLKQWQETRSVLLVGYAQCTNMSGEIGKYLTEGPGLMILDEGHVARTETTKILKSLSKVHTKRRVLLSGTPFNNNFEEFYTTLELVRPNFMERANAEMYPTLNALVAPEPKASEKVSPLLKRSSHAGRQAFKDAVGENLFEIGKRDSIARALGQMRRLIEPFVAWHKGQILETLPGITDLTVMLELSLQQRELLNNDRSDVRDNLQKRAAAIYVHPILEPAAEDGKRSQKDPRLRGENIELKQGVKLRWVLDLVQMCDDVNEKVLIFSEYLYSLALIENMAMQKMKWGKGSQILRIDGSMNIHEREVVINKFNTDPEAKMLCASIKACGEGVSLVGASRVVMLEVVWNPSVTRQAISRAFRIGQKKKVFVYRLIAADTPEEHRTHATATRKEWLSKLLFDPSISCDDPNSILWDVTKDCSDMFLANGSLRNGVKSIYEREF